ncbi:serine/threonine-protein kinase [Nonomuraea pusilla]|uniref:Serine/threonine protein kinase n=1 Tax=Nonomuraea pusilla TaxID=46177 RepID=A0A1H7XLQ1_9ACTN|nr:serine/threonine-protein kinase [Nonomuraea pusilla]SEM34148.1 Serine/threonine protein kinase [Nonomuraea pusilla]
MVTPLTPDDPVALGGYRLERRLGEGGQGVVYLGRGASGEPVAVKLLGAGDPATRARLARELDALAGIASFCTARVLDVSTGGPRPYVVSEYVDGPSLADRVRERGPLRGGDLERLAVGTATALAAIHAAGVVHRDLKPSNVLLGPDGPRVVDFGIARAEGAATLTSGLVGTPAYLAPEQIAGAPASAASDVFAWASTVLYAATGASPFGADTVPAVLHRVLHAEPDLSALPPRLREPVAACLSKDASRRPAARDLMVTLVTPNRRPASPSLPPAGPPAGPSPTTPSPTGAVPTPPSPGGPTPPSPGGPTPPSPGGPTPPSAGGPTPPSAGGPTAPSAAPPSLPPGTTAPAAPPSLPAATEAADDPASVPTAPTDLSGSTPPAVPGSTAGPTGLAGTAAPPALPASTTGPTGLAGTAAPPALPVSAAGPMSLSGSTAPPAFPASATGRTGLSVPPSSPVGTGAPGPARGAGSGGRVRRRGPLVAGVAGVVALVVAGGALLLVNRAPAAGPGGTPAEAAGSSTATSGSTASSTSSGSASSATSSASTTSTAASGSTGSAAAAAATASPGPSGPGPTGSGPASAPPTTGATAPGSPPPTTAPPLSGPPRIPAAFAGTWTGRTTSTDPRDSDGARDTVTLKAGASTAVWEEKDGQSGCATTIRLAEARPDALTFLLDGRKHVCARGTLVLALKGGVLTYTRHDPPGAGAVTQSGSLGKG